MTAAVAGNEGFATQRKVSEPARVAYRYRAFGEQTVQSGSSANRFTFVGKNGHYRQPDLGNYWLRARVYRDGSGRFLSRDPAEDEVNLYRYVSNRPLVLIDPAGLQGCRTPDQPCWGHRRGAGEYAAMGAGGPGSGMGAGGAGARGGRGMGGGGMGGGGRPRGGGGGGGRGGPRMMRIVCDDKPGWCCETPRPGLGWSNPARGHYRVSEWEAQASCPDCDKSSTQVPCWVTLWRHMVPKRGYEDRYSDFWDPLYRAGWQCVPCDQPTDGDGDGGPVCGPDITTQLATTMRWVDDVLTWMAQHKTWRAAEDCLYLNTHFGFDISILVGTYSEQTGLPENATFDGYGGCANGRCTGTVTVDRKCYYAHQVNYVLYGKLARFCGVARWLAEQAIRRHKKRTHRPQEIADAIAWMHTGYANWPFAGSIPPEQVGMCGDCPVVFQDGPLFCWVFGLDEFTENCVYRFSCITVTTVMQENPL